MMYFYINKNKKNPYESRKLGYSWNNLGKVAYGVWFRLVVKGGYE